MDEYSFCDTKDTFNDALEALSSASHIALDCEGTNLGKVEGKLSLIGLRTISPAGSQSFLVDVLQLDDSTLRPLFDILESSRTVKIVFDGRMDFNELYHSRNVSLANVLDLQLADISSRRLRGEDESRQLQRLSPYLRRGEVAANRLCYTQVEKLSGLAGCLKEHGIEVSENSHVSHDQWLQRPLSTAMLRYAARDIHGIDLLFDHFQRKSYINDELPHCSQHYIAMWKDERPKPWDDIKNNPLLPLNILDRREAAVLVCKSCQRVLPQKCYSKASQKTPEKRHCWVCRALKVKVNNQNQHSRDYDDERWCADSDEEYYG